LLDVEHVDFGAEGEGEDGGWVVVGFDVVVAEHGAGVVDVVEELFVNIGLGLEDV